MAADRPGRGAALVMLLVVLSASACTPGPADLSDGSASPGGTPAASPPMPNGAVLAPASTSGPLDAATLPDVAQLGDGWHYRTEGGTGEEGAGNGSPFQARDPHEIVRTTIPLGCERRSATAVPRYVLQATYAHPASSSYAVALRMRFDSPRAAARFARTRASDLAACRDQPDDPFAGTPSPVLDVRNGATTVTHYRVFGDGRVWTNWATAVGGDIITLDVSADSVDPARLGFPAS